ncbi:alkaline phosphatase family protein [Nocardioides zeae]|uniref:Alkaline phosphatase family protein n=1 Tax=Nocardioides imazamoxiresistens TaxID=3231893 RepID=A0ABU3PZB1_9ACTN|nr:alkaline phosphatase family protein [Nocardioides zeae]MDT9594588.1 alkaline phosphatase family protein [Nocardioides zeae]
MDAGHAGHAPAPGDAAAGRFVAPAYGARSLSDVVPAVAHALGVGRALDLAAPSGLVLPDAPAYVVFLVDGLGARLLERHADVAPFLSALAAGAEHATAGVPSTTATSLTSLGTGLVPGAHGLVGFTSRVPGTDRLFCPLQWDDDIDPLEWQPHPTLFERLVGAGVAVTSVNRREYEGSGLTVAAHRGATYVGADRVGERIAAVQRAVALRPSLTYVYDADLDWTGHRHGVASAAWLQQLAMVDAEAEQLREALPAEVRLVVVADHGMVDSPVHARVDVDDRPELLDGVWLLGGEARLRHLYCATRAVPDVIATWREVLGAGAEVLTREDALERGWFGDTTAAVRPRLGDVVVACTGSTAVVSRRLFPHEATLVGLHGSLTADEMLIPVLVA